MKRAIITLMGMFLFFSFFFTYSLITSKIKIHKLSKQLVQSATTDKEKVLKCLDYVANITTTNVKGYFFKKNKSDSAIKKFWIWFYSVPPVNLIPPKIVLEHNLSYTGPCGAKSKLLMAMLESVGYQCRELNQKKHTLVEVHVGKKWTPLDPTYNLYFIDKNGRLADTNKVKSDFNFLKQNIARLKIKYPMDNAQEHYKDIWRLDVFFYAEPHYLLIFFNLVITLVLFAIHRKMKK